MLFVKYFWSISCPVCIENLSKIDFLEKKYLDELDVVYIHRPMNESDLDEAQVRKVAVELGITEELIFDNDHKIGDEMGVDAWPTYFLIDADGTVRRHARGQLGVKMIEQALIRLLGEPSSD